MSTLGVLAAGAKPASRQGFPVDSRSHSDDSQKPPEQRLPPRRQHLSRTENSAKPAADPTMPTIAVDKYKLYEALGQKCVLDRPRAPKTALPLPLAAPPRPR